MTLRRTYPRVLIVEGKDELRVLPELLELAGIPWPKGNEPVRIEEQDGIANILAPGFIETTLKASGVTAVGIVVDANGDPVSRWQQVRDRFAASYSGFPVELSATGAIHVVADRPRVGVWVMPDNVRVGMLETLLLALRVGDPALHAPNTIDWHVSEPSAFRTSDVGTACTVNPAATYMLGPCETS